MAVLSEVEQDFINETLEILTDLCRCCSDLKGTGGVADARQAIQRGLHTIKGNSPAFGFDEFGEIASVLLDKVKNASKSGADVEGAGLAPLVLEFVTRSRQYLGLVRDGRTRPLFGGIFKSLRDQLQESAREPARRPERFASESHDQREEPPPRETRAAAGAGDTFAAGEKTGVTLKEKLEAILAKAPPVQPNLEQLSRLAARRLKPRTERSTGDRRARPAMDSTGYSEELPQPVETTSRDAAPEPAAPPPSDVSFETVPPSPPPEVPPAAPPPSEVCFETVPPSPPPEVPTAVPPSEVPPAVAPVEVPPIAASVDHGDSEPGTRRSEIAGLAFDALCARQAASVVSAYVDEDPDLGRQMARVSGFLERFCQWVRGQQLVSLRTLLDESAAELRSMAQRRGLDVGISVDPTDVLVPGLLGQVAQGAVNELLRGLSLLWKEADGDRSLAFAVTRGSNGAEIRISGAGSPTALAARLRVYPVKRRLQEMGGDLLTNAPGRNLVMVLPDNVHPMEVCLIRSGANQVGVPAHRVIDSVAIAPSDVTSGGSECRCVFEDEEIAVLDLTDNPLGADGDGAEERCLVVLRDDGQRHGLLVDELVGCAEMLVRLSAGLYQESDIVGSCFSVSEPRAVPLLDFRAPRDSRAEETRP